MAVTAMFLILRFTAQSAATTALRFTLRWLPCLYDLVSFDPEPCFFIVLDGSSLLPSAFIRIHPRLSTSFAFPQTPSLTLPRRTGRGGDTPCCARAGVA